MGIASPQTGPGTLQKRDVEYRRQFEHSFQGNKLTQSSLLKAPNWRGTGQNCPMNIDHWNS